MLFYTLEIVGMVAFAISGALAAVQHRMDLSGAVFLAVIVGNGGGTIRDLLLGAPVFWISQTQYIWIAVLTGLIVFAIAYFKLSTGSGKTLNNLLLIFDAVGLGVFVIAGTDKALSYHLYPSMAVLMGMITGIGGGIIRDILCNDIPVVFRRQLYATPALLGAIAYVLGIRYMNAEAAIWLGVSVIVLIRCLGLYRGWHLPMLRTDVGQHP